MLFNDQTEGVQGNSAGQVNIPEVRSAPTFICGKCEKGFETQAKLNKHKEEEQDDDDLLHAVREAEELYNALEILTQSEYDQEKEEESKQEMKEKLTRFWDILKKKTEFQMKSGQKIQNLEAEVQRLQDEVKLSSEVTTNQLLQLDEKDNEKDSLSKEVRGLIKVLQEKEVEISELKEINDEVVVIPPKDTMSETLTEHRCNACDKTFRKSHDLDKHMDAKHCEKQCTYCDKVCESE